MIEKKSKNVIAWKGSIKDCTATTLAPATNDGEKGANCSSLSSSQSQKDPKLSSKKQSLQKEVEEMRGEEKDLDVRRHVTFQYILFYSIVLTFS